jgi:hypothetical protein
MKGHLHPELWGSFITPPMSGTAGDATFDAVAGTVTLKNAVDKFTDVRITIEGVSLTETGELSHDQIEEKFELVNSGLSPNFAAVSQSNVIKAGIQDEIADPAEREAANQIVSGEFLRRLRRLVRHVQLDRRLPRNECGAAH